MYKIGITGGIGAGKSTVARIFEVIEIPVYYADQRAKVLMRDHLGLKKKILGLMGERSYLESGDLDRKWIASQVFSDPWLLNKLNGIVHPAVESDYGRWHLTQNAPYTVKEAALLFDAGSYLYMDATIVVAASEEVRIHRVIKRDGTNESSVRARMQAQWPENRRVELADFVVDNDGAMSLSPQIIAIHQRILQDV